MVLGGIEGIKHQFDKANSEEEKISIIKDSLRYGEIGKDWLFNIIKQDFGGIFWEAFYLLWNNLEDTAKQELTEYLPKLLKEDVFKWNNWRKDNHNFRIDFNQVNLSKIDLSGADLSNINFCNANLSRANLTNTDLTQSDFNNADLSKTNFTNAQFRKTKFVGANLSGANLKSADLRGKNLSNAKLTKANLSNAQLWRTNLSNADLSKANLSYVDLSEANIEGANLEGAIRKNKRSRRHYYESRWE